jgi:hypothetical protein
VGLKWKIFFASSIATATTLLMPQMAVADTNAFGADSGGPPPNGGSGNYTEPYCSGTHYYDVYLGQVGSGVSGGKNEYEPPGTSSTSPYDIKSDIDASYSEFQNGHGVGAAAYFFLTGPGDEGSYTPAQWGYEQAVYATNDYNSAFGVDSGYSYGVILADVETAEGTNGWTFSQANNQAVWNNFYETLQNSGTNVGVYSSYGAWKDIMGALTVGQLEWTYENDYGPVTPCPTGTFSGGPGGSAYNGRFFGAVDVTSDLAQMWQWAQSSGDGGVGDFDQQDLTHYNAVFGGLNRQP